MHVRRRLNSFCRPEVAAALAQLGERQTEDLKAPCSIHGGGMLLIFSTLFFPNKTTRRSTGSKNGSEFYCVCSDGFSYRLHVGSYGSLATC